jgi:hypothetical protein
MSTAVAGARLGEQSTGVEYSPNHAIFNDCDGPFWKMSVFFAELFRPIPAFGFRPLATAELFHRIVETTKPIYTAAGVYDNVTHEMDVFTHLTRPSGGGATFRTAQSGALAPVVAKLLTGANIPPGGVVLPLTRSVVEYKAAVLAREQTHPGLFEAYTSEAHYAQQHGRSLWVFIVSCGLKPLLEGVKDHFNRSAGLAFVHDVTGQPIVFGDQPGDVRWTGPVQTASHKAPAVEAWRGQFGIALERSLGIGDGETDDGLYDSVGTILQTVQLDDPKSVAQAGRVLAMLDGAYPNRPFAGPIPVHYGAHHHGRNRPGEMAAALRAWSESCVYEFTLGLQSPHLWGGEVSPFADQAPTAPATAVPTATAMPTPQAPTPATAAPTAKAVPPTPATAVPLDPAPAGSLSARRAIEAPGPDLRLQLPGLPF